MNLVQAKKFVESAPQEEKFKKFVKSAPQDLPKDPPVTHIEKLKKKKDV